MLPVRKVLITGGRETGGLNGFAQALAEGFGSMGLAVEVIGPGAIFRRWRELRDPSILKILSTMAVFAAPFARHALCIAHGFPRPATQGWHRTLAILVSLKIANLSPHCRLVAVSHYIAAHLRGVYNLRVDATVRNPVQKIFSEPWIDAPERTHLAYVGRLISDKNVCRLLPAMQRLLDEDRRLRISIIGDGPLKRELERIAQGDPRIEFPGNLNSAGVLQRLRQTCVFLSGNEMEPFGITYLEALSQGCAVVMPACGGGLEIAPELIGSQIQLFPISFDEEGILSALRRALPNVGKAFPLNGYRAVDAAKAYLEVAEAHWSADE
jgi:glycosyltransferase involved in cell wall biosynthesis